MTSEGEATALLPPVTYGVHASRALI